MSRKRTKKEFIKYNDYEDRPFGLKWGTAFALSELTQVIGKAKAADLKRIEPLPVMGRDAIDATLQKAFLKGKSVSIQLHTKDEQGNLMDNIVGVFSGIADAECLYIEGVGLEWASIRNVVVIV